MKSKKAEEYISHLSVIDDAIIRYLNNVVNYVEIVIKDEAPSDPVKLLAEYNRWFEKQFEKHLKRNCRDRAVIEKILMERVYVRINEQAAVRRVIEFAEKEYDLGITYI